VDVAVPQQATVSGGMLSLKKSTKKRKLPMKCVRLKNIKIKYVHECIISFNCTGESFLVNQLIYHFCKQIMPILFNLVSYMMRV
jgi:hypothetical protein